jgi:2-haloacid dehalogenase
MRRLAEDGYRNTHRRSKTSRRYHNGKLPRKIPPLTLPKSSKDWASFAQEWRNSYLTFTRAVAADPSMTWKTVDQHHLDSLHELLASRNLSNLWPKDKIENLSLVWHRLEPWSDTNAGLAALNDLGLQTATLTNGNLTLIGNMVKNANMPFKHVLSAEMFNSYKPNPAVYLGAAEKLGLKPEECGMVAAHLGDLEGAQKCGFATVYVERPEEERDEQLREKEGLVDVWVEMEEDGFVVVAEKLRSMRSR